MKTTFKKTACAVLASTVFFTMTACSETKETEKTKKEEETTTTEETTEETSEVDTDEILVTVTDYCDAVADTDGEKIVALSTEDLEDADTIVDYLNFDECTAYSSDMGDILAVVADTITYESDEDSLEVAEDGETAQIDVVFNVAAYLGDSDAEYADIDEFAAAVENAEAEEFPTTISLELTDDGWKISNTQDVFDDVYVFMIMAYIEPDFEFGADTSSDEEPAVTAEGDMPILTYYDREWFEAVGTYPEVQYDPSYIATLTYADYEIEFSGFSGSNISDWDFAAHTGTVDTSRYDSFDIALSYNCDIDDPDLTGFVFTIDGGGSVCTVYANSALEVSVMVDSATTGDYTITLSDPWGRTVWEGYIEVV